MSNEQTTEEQVDQQRYQIPDPSTIPPIWFEDSEREGDHVQPPLNIYREFNPDEWDPDAGDEFNAGTVNIDVSDTVGPDAVGQNTADVDGHKYDRDPDMTFKHARKLALRGEFDDISDEQPMPLLESNIRYDPIEGAVGTYTIVSTSDGECPHCGSSYHVAKVGVMTHGMSSLICLLCETDITHEKELWY